MREYENFGGNPGLHHMPLTRRPTSVEFRFAEREETELPGPKAGAKAGERRKHSSRGVAFFEGARQNQWYHFGVGAPPILLYFSGDWDVGYGILTHGHVAAISAGGHNFET